MPVVLKTSPQRVMPRRAMWSSPSRGAYESCSSDASWETRSHLFANPNMRSNSELVSSKYGSTAQLPLFERHISERLRSGCSDRERSRIRWRCATARHLTDGSPFRNRARRSAAVHRERVRFTESECRRNGHQQHGRRAKAPSHRCLPSSERLRDEHPSSRCCAHASIGPTDLLLVSPHLPHRPRRRSPPGV